MPVNPIRERFINSYVDVIDVYPRKFIMLFDSNVMEHIIANVYPICYLFLTASTDLYISNNTIKNVTSQMGLIFMNTAKSVTLENSALYDNIGFGSYVYYLFNTPIVIAKKLIVRNVV
mmetsp:Transcript_17099/g.19725  ORF Transcript_17099/g.19725 Transcript_17099/m.19725 type:complete len:118 (-) Transcript_17099:262-615(-)